MVSSNTANTGIAQSEWRKDTPIKQQQQQSASSNGEYTVPKRQSTRDCLCQLGEACSGMSTAFAILKDPRGCFVQLPKDDAPLVEAYCQYLRPSNGISMMSNNNNTLYVAVHHFDPSILEQQPQLQMEHCIEPDLLPFPSATTTTDEAQRNLLAEFLDTQSMGWILPSYGFHQAHRDLRHAMQQRVAILQEETQKKRELRKTRRRELLEKFANRMSKPPTKKSSSKSTTTGSTSSNRNKVAPMQQRATRQDSGMPDFASSSSAPPRTTTRGLAPMTVREDLQEHDAFSQQEAPPTMTQPAKRQDSGMPDFTSPSVPSRTRGLAPMVETVREDLREHDAFGMSSDPPMTQRATRQDSGMPDFSTATPSRTKAGHLQPSVGTVREDLDEHDTFEADDHDAPSIPSATARQDSGMPDFSMALTGPPQKTTLVQHTPFGALTEEEEEEEEEDDDDRGIELNDTFDTAPEEHEDAELPMPPQRRQDSGMPDFAVAVTGPPKRSSLIQPNFETVFEDEESEDYESAAEEEEEGLGYETPQADGLGYETLQAATRQNVPRGRTSRRDTGAHTTSSSCIAPSRGVQPSATFDTCEEGEEDAFDTIEEGDEDDEDESDFVSTPTRATSITRGYFSPSSSVSPVVVSESRSFDSNDGRDPSLYARPSKRVKPIQDGDDSEQSSRTRELFQPNDDIPNFRSNSSSASPLKSPSFPPPPNFISKTMAEEEGRKSFSPPPPPNFISASMAREKQRQSTFPPPPNFISASMAESAGMMVHAVPPGEGGSVDVAKAILQARNAALRGSQAAANASSAMKQGQFVPPQPPNFISASMAKQSVFPPPPNFISASMAEEEARKKLFPPPPNFMSASMAKEAGSTHASPAVTALPGDAGSVNTAMAILAARNRSMAGTKGGPVGTGSTQMQTKSTGFIPPPMPNFISASMAEEAEAQKRSMFPPPPNFISKSMAEEEEREKLFPPPPNFIGASMAKEAGLDAPAAGSMAISGNTGDVGTAMAILAARNRAKGSIATGAPMQAQSKGFVPPPMPNFTSASLAKEVEAKKLSLFPQPPNFTSASMASQQAAQKSFVAPPLPNFISASMAAEAKRSAFPSPPNFISASMASSTPRQATTEEPGFLTSAMQIFAARSEAKAASAKQAEPKEELDDFRSLLKSSKITVEQSDDELSDSGSEEHERCIGIEEDDDVSALGETSLSDPGRPISSINGDDDMNVSQISGLSATKAPEGDPKFSRYNLRLNVGVFWGIIILLSVTNLHYANEIKMQKALERGTLKGPATVPTESPWESAPGEDVGNLETLSPSASPPPRRSWLWGRSPSMDLTEDEVDVLTQEMLDNAAADTSNGVNVDPPPDVPKASSWFWGSSKSAKNVQTNEAIEDAAGTGEITIPADEGTAVHQEIVEKDSTSQHEVSAEETAAPKSSWFWGRSPNPAPGEDALDDSEPTAAVELDAEDGTEVDKPGRLEDPERPEDIAEKETTKQKPSKWFWGSSPTPASSNVEGQLEGSERQAESVGQDEIFDREHLADTSNAASEATATETTDSLPEDPTTQASAESVTVSPEDSPIKEKPKSSWFWGKSPAPVPNEENKDSVDITEEVPSAEDVGLQDENDAETEIGQGEPTEDTSNTDSEVKAGIEDVAEDIFEANGNSAATKTNEEKAPTSSWFWGKKSASTSPKEDSEDVANESTNISQVGLGDVVADSEHAATPHDNVSANTLGDMETQGSSEEMSSEASADVEGGKHSSWFWGGKASKDANDIAPATAAGEVERDDSVADSNEAVASASEAEEATDGKETPSSKETTAEEESGKSGTDNHVESGTAGDETKSSSSWLRWRASKPAGDDVHRDSGASSVVDEAQVEEEGAEQSKGSAGSSAEIHDFSVSDAEAGDDNAAQEETTEDKEGLQVSNDSNAEVITDAVGESNTDEAASKGDDGTKPKKSSWLWGKSSSEDETLKSPDSAGEVTSVLETEVTPTTEAVVREDDTPQDDSEDAPATDNAKLVLDSSGDKNADAVPDPDEGGNKRSSWSLWRSEDSSKTQQDNSEPDIESVGSIENVGEAGSRPEGVDGVQSVHIVKDASVDTQEEHAPSIDEPQQVSGDTDSPGHQLDSKGEASLLEDPKTTASSSMWQRLWGSKDKNDDSPEEVPAPVEPSSPEEGGTGVQSESMESTSPVTTIGGNQDTADSATGEGPEDEVEDLAASEDRAEAANRPVDETVDSAPDESADSTGKKSSWFGLRSSSSSVASESPASESGEEGGNLDETKATESTSGVSGSSGSSEDVTLDEVATEGEGEETTDVEDSSTAVGAAAEDGAVADLENVNRLENEKSTSKRSLWGYFFGSSDATGEEVVDGADLTTSEAQPNPEDSSSSNQPEIDNAVQNVDSQVATQEDSNPQLDESESHNEEEIPPQQKLETLEIGPTEPEQSEEATAETTGTGRTADQTHDSGSVSDETKSSWSLRGTLKSFAGYVYPQTGATSAETISKTSGLEGDFKVGGLAKNAEDAEALAKIVEEAVDALEQIVEEADASTSSNKGRVGSAETESSAFTVESKEPSSDAESAKPEMASNAGILGKGKGVASSSDSNTEYNKNASSSSGPGQADLLGEGEETASVQSAEEIQPRRGEDVETTVAEDGEPVSNEDTNEDVTAASEPIKSESKTVSDVKTEGVLSSSKKVLGSLMGFRKDEESAPEAVEEEIVEQHNEGAVEGTDSEPPKTAETAVETPEDRQAEESVDGADEATVEKDQLANTSTSTSQKIKYFLKRAIVAWYNSGFALESTLLVFGVYFYWGRV